MLLFTYTMFKYHPPVYMMVIWLVALAPLEWLSYNMVSAYIYADGLAYKRVTGIKVVKWDMIKSISLWEGAPILIVTLHGRSLLSRYKFLADPKPSLRVVFENPSDADPIEIVRLRNKLHGL